MHIYEINGMVVVSELSLCYGDFKRLLKDGSIKRESIKTVDGFIAQINAVRIARHVFTKSEIEKSQGI